MTVETVHIAQLLSYLFRTFEGDEELVHYFDPGCAVRCWEDCCVMVHRKIKTNYPDAILKGVKEGDKSIGFYVFEKDVLISFGMHKDYRHKEYLIQFWEHIRSEFQGSFSCVLYSRNARAIRWLQKAGMKKLLENVTILSLCPQED